MDSFETDSQDFELSGGEGGADLTDVQTALAAALAVVTTANQVSTLGVATLIDTFGDRPDGTTDTDCDAGTSTLRVSQPAGLEKRLVFETDQCFTQGQDQVSDGEFTLDIADSGSDIEGELELGGDLSPFVVADRGGSNVAFTQLSGDASFFGDDDGVPLTYGLSNLRLIAGNGDEPAGDAQFLPDRWLETLAGVDSIGPMELDVTGSSSAGVEVTVDGPMSAEGHNLSAACTDIGRFNVVTTDLAIDRTGTAVGGTLTLTVGADQALVEFAPDGSANVTVPGDSQAFTAAQVAALCNL